MFRALAVLDASPFEQCHGHIETAFCRDPKSIEARKRGTPECLAL